MNFLEEKREYNNILFRKYHSSKNTDSCENNLNELLLYNYDLVSYTILKYFPSLKVRKDIYEVGVAALIMAIELYEMDNMTSFEIFLIANIKNSIEIYEKNVHPIFVANANVEINYGDIWYSREHNIEETLKTKNIRDNLTTKIYKKSLKKSKS